jgi:hypothetical protein
VSELLVCGPSSSVWASDVLKLSCRCVGARDVQEPRKCLSGRYIRAADVLDHGVPGFDGTADILEPAEVLELRICWSRAGIFKAVDLLEPRYLGAAGIFKAASILERRVQVY